MLDWKIPHGVGLTPNGHNNTAVEQFLNTIVDSLTREVIQNSLDASDPENDKPVIVKFDEFSTEQSMIPSCGDIKDFALPKAIEYWKEKNNKDTLKYLDLFSKTLNSKKIDVLKISDFNTIGLRSKNYESLIIGNGYSEKDNISSAGSKGIGKAAPFAASNLRMVFYNSLNKDKEYKSAGIVNFVSFNYDEENITQERLSYISNDNTQITFEDYGRKQGEYGTDLFVIGLKKFENLYLEILLSSINNFLLSIKKGDLEIIVNEERLNSETLDSIIDKLSKSKLRGNSKIEFNKTKNFYDVLTNENSLKFELDDELVQKYDFIDNNHDAVLYLLEHENANRSILQTRNAGMKIYERKGINGNINFTGIFQATGDKLNEFLKDMENANHDTWSPDRKEGKEKRVAEKFLVDLYRWYKSKVSESFETSSEDEVEAFGVSSFLPLDSEQAESKKYKESGINNSINKIEIKRNSNKKQMMDGDKEEDLISKIIQTVETGEGDSSGSGSDRTGGTGGNTPGNQGSYGDGENGDKGESDSGSKKVAEGMKMNGKINSIKFKIIEENSVIGKYKIVGKCKKRYKKIAIDIKYVGGDGKAYYLKLMKAHSLKHQTTISQNKIIIENIQKDEYININFQINSKLKTKMEGIIYEIES